MTLTSARATFRLSGRATLAAFGTSGSLQLVPAPQTAALPSATAGYHLLAIFAGSGDALVLKPMEAVTTGSTAWVAGSAQTTTATAAGTITTSGRATLTLTSAGMSGSPLAITFDVRSGDTAAEWAAKARRAATSNATLAERFIVSGTTTAITLTRRATHTFPVPGGSLPIYPATDATLNLALADDTAAGITEAATSSGSAGTATDGVRIFDGDGRDITGDYVDLYGIHALQLVLTSAAGMTLTDGTEAQTLAPGEIQVRSGTDTAPLSLSAAQTYTAAAAASLSITALGPFSLMLRDDEGAPILDSDSAYIYLAA